MSAPLASSSGTSTARVTRGVRPFGSAIVRGRPRISASARWPWYPTLIGLVYVVHPMAKFDVEPGSGTRPLALALGLGLLVTLAWTRILGRDRGAAAAAITVMAFVGATSALKLLPFAAAIALIGIESVWARKGTLRVRLPWTRLTETLNVLLAALVLIELVTAANVRLQRPEIPAPAAWATEPASGAPNIFVILVDGHGRADVMQRAYGYDPSSFRQSMILRGFEEASGSFANHAATRFSLAVLLNGRPMSELGQDLSEVASDTRAYASLRSSSVIALLDEAGYHTTTMASGYEGLAPGNVDEVVDTGPSNELERIIVGGTALGGVLGSIGEGSAVDQGYRTLREADILRQMAQDRSRKPRFVFAHLPAPHPPFALDASCAIRPADDLTLGSEGRSMTAGDDRSIALVRDQTACADRLILEVVGDIVAAQPNAVVVVLSDHGPEEELDWWHPSEPAINDRMANLFWARTPGHPGLFPDDVTLVNVFPLLFNAYLGTNLPTHPNDLFFGPTPDNSYLVPYRP